MSMHETGSSTESSVAYLAEHQTFDTRPCLLSLQKFWLVVNIFNQLNKFIVNKGKPNYVNSQMGYGRIRICGNLS